MTPKGPGFWANLWDSISFWAESGIRKFYDLLASLMGSRTVRFLRYSVPLVERINALELEASRLSDDALKERMAEIRLLIREGKERAGYYDLVKRAEAFEAEFNTHAAAETRKRATAVKNKVIDEFLVEVFAMTREAAKRGIGQRLFDVQLLGGIALHKGHVVEMITGEGKTLVATLPAALNALDRDEGEASAIHIVTVNDYLARRDAAWMRPIYEMLGLTVGCIQSQMESHERQPQYDCDVTYGTNNEFGFDYLRDNMKIDARLQVQRRRNFAIVDEVDSALIDEARTPLIISGAAEEAADKYYRADEAVKRLRGADANDLEPLVDEKIRAGMDKAIARMEVEEQFDYVYSEKDHTAHLGERGLEKCSRHLHVDDFYSGANQDWPHYLENGLKANALYKRDRHYVLKGNEVIIVDEFTGRLMHGRRWSDGLHQAVEAKERLRIREENQTLATITFQNFFKLYEKLAGMTGTAMTDAPEYKNVYNVKEVIAIAPNRPLRRTAYDDIIYGSEMEKFNAIVDEIVRLHSVGRPVLVGTVSIEKSEALSRMLTRNGVPHEVLNAKHHEREAMIVARAGELGRVTVATNMAGRGTDIVLGEFTTAELLEHWKKMDFAPQNLRADLAHEQLEGELVRFWAKQFLGEHLAHPTQEIEEKLRNYWEERSCTPPALCESVARLGGLHVVGTERHEARRIDDQLRGRAGRQGDPGSSRFFLSLEDDLMRIFASETVRNILRRLGLKEGQPLEHPMVSRAIKKAQLRVEERNFGLRKRLMEYDEVMNEQRLRIYKWRQDALLGRNLRQLVGVMIEDTVADTVSHTAPRHEDRSEWDIEGLARWMKRKFGIEVGSAALESARSPDELEKKLNEIVPAVYDERENVLGPERMRIIERFVLLDVIDKKWKDHLRDMDHLRDGIWLRSFARRDPKNEYKREGLDLFRQMLISIYEEVTNRVLKVQLVGEGIERELESRWAISEVGRGELGGFGEREAMQQASEHGGAEVITEPIKRKGPRVGRNAPCPCGSGKKYKNCCGRKAPTGAG